MLTTAVGTGIAVAGRIGVGVEMGDGMEDGVACGDTSWGRDVGVAAGVALGDGMEDGAACGDNSWGRDVGVATGVGLAVEVMPGTITVGTGLLRGCGVEGCTASAGAGGTAAGAIAAGAGSLPTAGGKVAGDSLSPQASTHSRLTTVRIRVERPGTDSPRCPDAWRGSGATPGLSNYWQASQGADGVSPGEVGNPCFFPTGLSPTQETPCSQPLLAV